MAPGGLIVEFVSIEAQATYHSFQVLTHLAYLQLSVLLIILVFGNLWGVILDEAMDIKYTKNLYSHFKYLALGYPGSLACLC